MLPLKGIRVLDITRLLPGGFCSHLLSEYGAEVVKVEQPGLGDYIRSAPPLFEGVSLLHTMINRDKRSIGIDLKHRQGREVLRALVSRSDVFLEGFRPGVAGRLGFSFEQVKKLNPTVVYCSISAFGESSPMSSMPAHDLNFQAMSGMLGSSQSPEVPLAQTGDYVSGLYAALGIAAALRRGRRTATRIDVPIVQSLMSLLMLPASSYFATGLPPRRGQDLVLGSEPYYAVYETSDRRFVAVAAIEQRFWENLTRELGLQRLAHLRNGTRGERARLRSALKKAFAAKTRDEWSSLLMDKDTCVTPVLDVHEALDSEWAKSTGMIGRIGDRPVLNQPIRFAGRRPTGDAPSLGEHTRAILRELGYPSSKVERLIEAGAVE